MLRRRSPTLFMTTTDFCSIRNPFIPRRIRFLPLRYGKVFDWTVKSKMIGLRAEDSAHVVIQALQLPLSVAEYLEERKHLLEEMFPQAEAMPGAMRLSLHLHQAGIPQAVATSSDRFYFDLKITRHQEWYKIFQCVVLGDDPEIQARETGSGYFFAGGNKAAGESRTLPRV